MKNILLAALFLIINNCNGQKNNTITKQMKTFNIQKFEENKGKQGYPDEYHYKLRDDFDAKELDVTSNATMNIKTYQREITKEFYPYKYTHTYDGNGILKREVIRFNSSGIKILDFDKTGNIIKEQNFDKDFKHSFEQIHDIVLKEKNVDIYDTRQAVALRHDTPNAIIKKYYQIHVLNSKLIGTEWQSLPNYSFIIDDATGKIVKSSESQK